MPSIYVCNVKVGRNEFGRRAELIINNEKPPPRISLFDDPNERPTNNQRDADSEDLFGERPLPRLSPFDDLDERPTNNHRSAQANDEDDDDFNERPPPRFSLGFETRRGDRHD